jgi:hypothetical protein
MVQEELQSDLVNVYQPCVLAWKENLRFDFLNPFNLSPQTDPFGTQKVWRLTVTLYQN